MTEKSGQKAQRQRSAQYQAILFDLDGTLADTAPDLAGAVNSLLRENGRDPMPEAALRPMVSYGGAGLIQRAFSIDTNSNEFKILRERFLAIYEDNICSGTTLYSGIETVLEAIEFHGLRWGVITNKPEYLTLPLMQELRLHQRSACIVGGDTTAHPKPHPAPMLHACSLIDIDPSDCLYLGDNIRDIEAAQAVGMDSLAVSWGYLDADDNPHDWGATDVVDNPSEIIDWLRFDSDRN